MCDMCSESSEFTWEENSRVLPVFKYKNLKREKIKSGYGYSFELSDNVDHDYLRDGMLFLLLDKRCSPTHVAPIYHQFVYSDGEFISMRKYNEGGSIGNDEIQPSSDKVVMGGSLFMKDGI